MTLFCWCPVVFCTQKVVPEYGPPAELNKWTIFLSLGFHGCRSPSHSIPNHCHQSHCIEQLVKCLHVHPGISKKRTYEDKWYAQFLTYSAKLNPKEPNQFRFLIITWEFLSFHRSITYKMVALLFLKVLWVKNVSLFNTSFPNYNLNWRWHSNVLVHLL